MFAPRQSWLILALLLLGLVFNLCASVPVDVDPVIVDPHPDPDPAPAPDPDPAPAPAPDPAPDPIAPNTGTDPNPEIAEPEGAPPCIASSKRGLEKRMPLCSLIADDSKTINQYIKSLDKNPNTKILDGGDGRWPTSMIETLGDDKFNLALTPGDQLSGCTIVTAYSAKGEIYWGHIWEVPGFTTGEHYPQARTEAEFYDFLENGQATSQNPLVWKGAALNSDAFKNAQAHISWLTPGNEVNGVADHGAILDGAEEKIRDWLGQDTTFDRQVYQRPDDADDSYVSPYFEYDPTLRRSTASGPAPNNARIMWGGPNGRVAWTRTLPRAPAS